MKLVFAVALIALTLPGHSWAQSAVPTAGGGEPVLLDRVVAVINGEVLLESDVEQEMHFAALEPLQSSAGGDTRQKAMMRLVNRSLIVQQMKEQQQFNVSISDAEVEKSLKELRTHLPACAKYDCASDKGWNEFLAANDLTNQEVVDHWRERMAILGFIDQRFRPGIRISQQSVADYYAKSLVPTLERQGKTPPPLKDVSARIQEILVQQQVNGSLQDWVSSLHEEGSIRILDPAYKAAASTSDSESRTGAEE